MRAAQIKQYGGPVQLELVDLALPEANSEQVLVKVHAFGVNRAEAYMRSGAWGDVARVTGIECVGEVAHDGRGQLARGQHVFALMGGMGRSINGSYAEYVSVPGNNVVPIESELSWFQLAAIPESYATAYSCLEENLALRAGQLLLVRAGMSALGQAAINIGRQRGARVFATTRSESSLASLRELGAEPLLERTGAALDFTRGSGERFDAVLDIVGTSTMLDSLAATRRGGRVCVAGFLGGHDPIALDPVMQLPSGVQLSVFASFMLGTPDFPLSRIPFQDIVRSAAHREYRAQPARVFRFADVAKAHQLMEANGAGGKIVVTVSDEAHEQARRR